MADINHGWILNPNNTLSHNSTAKTRVSKSYTDLTIGKLYNINITVSNYESGYLKILANDIESNQFTGNGIKTLSVSATSDNFTISLESNGLLSVDNINITYTDTPLIIIDYSDEEMFENKSFTVSYDPIGDNWISYHSYLPSIYINHREDYLIFEKGLLKRSNSNNYSSEMPFIIETVFNEHPLDTKVFDSITVNLESYYNDVIDNDFFDELIIYNEQQISSMIPMNNNNLTKKEKNWNIHKLLDESFDIIPKKLFTNDWNDIKDKYPIDKLINPSIINTNKEWFRKGRFRDKYFVTRFIYNNLVNKKILCNFVTSKYRISKR